jgi:hypothetical protein
MNYTTKPILSLSNFVIKGSLTPEIDNQSILIDFYLSVIAISIQSVLVCQ